MKALTDLTGIAAPIEGANVDTDRIIPARLLRNPRDAERTYAGALFHDVRFRDDGTEISDFILNQSTFRNAQILVCGRNFGCGSSRESAVYALFDYGIRCIVAPSFGDIFYSNCVRNGLAPLRVSEEEATRLRQTLMDCDKPVVTVDIRELTVTGPDGQVYEAELPSFQQHRLVNGVDEIEATLELNERIEAFETDYLQTHPWLSSDAGGRS